MNPDRTIDHWHFITDYLQRRPGFHLPRIEKLAGVKTGTLSQLLRAGRSPEPETGILLARVLQQFGLLVQEAPDMENFPQHAILIPHLLNWLNEHQVMQIAWLEKTAGIPATALSRALRTGVLPEKHVSKLVSLLLLYGYSVPRVKTG